jgi:hypothetical protein
MAQAVRRRSVASEVRLVWIALVITIPSAFRTHSSVIDPLYLTNFFVSVGNAKKKMFICEREGALRRLVLVL